MDVVLQWKKWKKNEEYKKKWVNGWVYFVSISVCKIGNVKERKKGKSIVCFWMDTEKIRDEDIVIIWKKKRVVENINGKRKY